MTIEKCVYPLFRVMEIQRICEVTATPYKMPEDHPGILLVSRFRLSDGKDPWKDVLEAECGRCQPEREIEQ